MSSFLDDVQVWGPLVRMYLGVTDIDLPDGKLDNPLLIGSAEDRIKRLLPSWESHLDTSTYDLILAATCFYASMWTDWCRQNVLLLERESTFSAERTRTDWDAVHADLIAMGFQYLKRISPQINLEIANVSVVSPATPLYRE